MRRTESSPVFLARLSGHLGPIVTLGGILLAIVVSDSFSWSESALSDLGVAASTALLFNGGLVVGGLLGLPYAYALWDDGPGGVGRLTPLLFALAMTTMGLVGVFVSGHPLHYPAALSFYLLVSATLVLDGLARRSTQEGRVAALLGVAHLVGWVVWTAGVRFGTGLAVPETVGALVFVVWVLRLSPAGLLSSRVR